MLPDVEGVGNDGTILGGEGDDDEEWPRTTDGLALGALTFGAGITVGAVVGAGVDLAAGMGIAGMNSAMASPPVTVHQLNLNSSTVSGSPVSSQYICSVSNEFQSFCSEGVNS
jgi:hypothetical protein